MNWQTVSMAHSDFSKSTMPFVKHIDSSRACKEHRCIPQAQMSTKHQSFRGYLNAFNLQSDIKISGEIVSFKQQLVPPELNQNVSVQSKSEPNEQTFNKRHGTGNIKGQLCKMELATLFLLQGLMERADGKIHGFHLAANMEEAGDFKDVVYKYKYRCPQEKDQIRKEKSKLIFLHSMHVDDVESKKVTVDVLSSEAGEKRSLVINLQKHFSSYRDIKRQFEEKRDHPIFGSSFEDSSFMIYTNALPAFKDGENMVEQTGDDLERIFRIEGRESTGYYYKMIFYDNDVGKMEQKVDSRIVFNQKIISILQDSSEYRKLVKELVKTVFDCEEGKNPEITLQGIFKKYHIPLSETVIMKNTKGEKSGKFSSVFINGGKSLSQQDRDFRNEFFKEAERVTGSSEIELKQELGSKIIKLPDKFGDRAGLEKDSVVLSLPNDHVHEDEIRTFLNKLRFHVGMPDESEIAEIIKEKAKNAFGVDQEDVETILSDVKTKVHRWWQEKNYYLTERNKFFHDSIRISIFFDVKRPVEMFKGRRKELEKLHTMILNMKETTAMSQMTIVTGMGGIGKSELVRQYVYKHSKDYDNNVIWIKAESYGTLVDSFCRLAQNVLKIRIKNTDGTIKGIRSVVEDVYNYFCKRKCLFIFDNAEKYETEDDTDPGIDKFISSLSKNDKIFIVVTSRNQNWGTAKTLPLDVFSKEDASAFIKAALNIQNEFQEDEIEQLSETLHRFPLVIQQVAAYLNEERKNLANKGEKFSICGYLEEYKKEGMKMKELLDFQLTHSSDYGRTTFVTWKMSMQKIRTMNHGDKALDILYIIGYFAPDSISTKIFLGRIAEKRVLASALQLLKQYSVIFIENSEAKIHRLFQQVIREDLKAQQKENEVLANAMQLLKNAMEGGDEMRRVCTSHAISTWAHASKCEELVKKFSDMPVDIMLELSKKGIIREEAYVFGRNAFGLLESVLGAGHADTLLMMNAVAVACEHRGRYDEALTFYRSVHDRLANILASDHPLVLTVQSNVATALTNQGNYDEASKVCAEVLDQRRKMLGDNHSDTLSSLRDEAMILNNQGKYDKAVEAYEEVLQKKQKMLGPNHRDTLSTKQELAITYYHQGKYEKAINTYEEVFEQQNYIFGPDDPETLRTKNNMTLILCARGQYNEALPSCEELIDKAEQVIGPGNIQSFIPKLCKARILNEQGYYAEALASYQELLDQNQDLLGPDHPDVLQTYDIKASVLLEQGRYDQALLAYNEILNRKRRVFGCDDPQTLQTQHSKATVLVMQGKYNEALLIYKEVLEKRKRLFGSHKLATLTTEHDIAGVLVDQGRFYEALETYRNVLKELQPILEPDHPAILMAKGNVASVLTELGRYDAALETYAEVLDRKKNRLDPSTLLTQINMTTVLHRQGKYDKALLKYQELLEICKQVLHPDHPLNWTILSNMAGVLQDKEYYDMALDIYQKVLDKRNQILDSDHPDVLMVKDSIASVFCRQGKCDQALNMFSEVLEKRNRSLGLDHPESLRTLSNVATVLAAQANYQESLETFQEVLNRRTKVLIEDHPDTLVTQGDIARILFEQGKYGESLNIYQDVLEKKKRTLGLLHPSTLGTQNNIAMLFLKQGNYSDALKIFNEVLDKRKLVLGPGHPDTLDVMDDIAEVLNIQGYHDLSLKTYENALDKRKKFLGPNHPDTLNAESNVASALFQQNLYTEALNAYWKVFVKMEKILSPDHPFTVHVRNNMATLLRVQGNYEDSFKIFQEVLEKRKKILGPTHPDTLRTLSEMARVIGAQRHFDLSMEAHRDVLAKRKKALGPDHPDTLRTEDDIAEIFFEQGNYEMAMKIYRKLLDKILQVYGPNSPLVLRAQNKIAMSLEGAKKYDEALEAYNDLFRRSEQMLGSDHPYTLYVIDDIATVLHHQGKYDDALKISQEVLHNKEKALGPHHPSTLFTMERVTRALGDTEEYFAVIKTCTQVLDKELILALYNSDPPTTGYLVLHMLCREGELHVLNHLLENGANVLARNDDHTLVHQAATNKNGAVVKLILDKIKEMCGNITSHIDETDEEGDTPLMWAAETGNINSARILLECGANVNAKNKSGQTALHWAVKGGFKYVVELLLDNDIDPNVEDINGATALDLAYLEDGITDEENFKSVISSLLTFEKGTVQLK